MPEVTLTPHEEQENLKLLVAMLNDRRVAPKDRNYRQEDAVKLRRLVNAWRAMMDNNGNRQSIDDMKLDRKDRADLQRFPKGLQMTLEWDGTLRIHDGYPHPFDPALIHFVRFLYNHQKNLLGGPCAGIRKRTKCGVWFIKSDPKREFCSHRCAATARKARQRKAIHEKRIEKALKAIGNYPGRPARFKNMDWRQYVNQATGLSKRFLTMAIEQGELIEPKGEHHGKG